MVPVCAGPSDGSLRRDGREAKAMGAMGHIAKATPRDMGLGAGALVGNSLQPLLCKKL